MTSYHIPDPTQLHEQADTIFDLNIQREYLTKEFADERIRWEAERDNFIREAEALIARRSRGGESTYREEVCSFLLAFVLLAYNITGTGTSSTNS